MRFALIALVTLSLCGCSKEQPGPFPTSAPSVPAPPTPVPPPRTDGVVAVVVIDHFGGCVSRATVEIVRGYGLGRSLIQSDNCSYWDPDYRAVFYDLIVGEELTLRASAPGYTSVEKTMVPSSRLGPYMHEGIELSRTQ
jgi:hypothetical protein